MTNTAIVRLIDEYEAARAKTVASGPCDEETMAALCDAEDQLLDDIVEAEYSTAPDGDGAREDIAARVAFAGRLLAQDDGNHMPPEAVARMLQRALADLRGLEPRLREFCHAFASREGLVDGPPLRAA